MAAKIQFDWQAEQLLMNKMLILLEDEEGGGGAGEGLASSPRAGSLSSLRGGRKSPKQGKTRSKSESEESSSPPPPDQLRRQSPARKSLLLRKGSAEGSPAKGNPTNGKSTNGSNTNDSPGNGNSTNGSPVNGSPTNGSAKKAKSKGGFLGLLSSKNKKNKEKSSPPPPTNVQKLQPLQRPLGKPGGKQDAKMEVRKALAMEAQRLRAQQAGGDEWSVDAVHPRYGRRVPASPGGGSLSSLSPEQRRARMEAQAQQTESLLQNMHAQLVLQQGGARSPPSTPGTPTSPVNLASSRSPPPDLKLDIRPTVPQPSPRSPPTSPPTSPMSPGVQADRSLPASPVVPLPSPRTLPSPSSPTSPGLQATLSHRSPSSPTSPGLQANLSLSSPPSPSGPGTPKQASSALLDAERNGRSPPLSPTLSQLDGSPGQRRRAQAAAIAKRAQSPQPRSPPPTPPVVAEVDGKGKPRQQGRRAMSASPSPTSAAPQQEGMQRTDPQRQSARRGLLGLFQSIRKGASPKQQQQQQQDLEGQHQETKGSPPRPQPQPEPKASTQLPQQQAPHRGSPQQRPPPQGTPQGPPRSPPPRSPQQEPAPQKSPLFSETNVKALPNRNDLSDVALSMFHQQISKQEHSSSKKESSISKSFEKTSSSLQDKTSQLLREEISQARREETSQERFEKSSQARREETSQERFEKSSQKTSQERFEKTSQERREESSRFEQSSQSHLGETTESLFKKMSRPGKDSIPRESFEKSSESRQEEFSRESYDRSSQSGQGEVSRDRFEKSSQARQEELLRERYARDGDGSSYERTYQSRQDPPRESTTSLSYQRGSADRAAASPSHQRAPASPRERQAAAAGGPSARRQQQQQQVRPEVQQTEHLLHAERTDQKPPLPRGAQHSKRGAAEAASSSSKKGKTYCQSCKKKCSGEVLRVQDKYFHIACFKCKVCRNSLAQGGFFCKDGAYYCTSDYQRQFGTKCAVCNEYVEGEVVSALGNTYHQKCFTCGRCRQAFPSGERVTYTGKEVLCARCVQIPVRSSEGRATSASLGSPTSGGASLGGGLSAGGNECAGCHEELKECQALIALDRQWHIWCFKCNTCDAVLHGEYMGKDGVPYCEKDYQKKFGVRCAYCNRYISGKVLQAGDNHHFHPTCARCTKCGDPFGDGEEMYLQGGAIWHPRCGPGPTENGAILNGVENGHCTDTETEAESGRDTAFDRMSSSAVSDMQFSIRSRTPSLNGSFNSLSRKYPCQRTGSPGLILREYKQNQYPEDISRIYTYSYLTEEPTQGYLKRPIDPYDKPPTSPHFHRPSSAASGRGSKLTHLSSKHGSRTGMTVLVDAIRSETPRPRSPHMNNEEPIELAHFPAAKPPQPGEAPKIEREDFPAPPYPYTDPERRRRWSDTYKGVPISDDEDENDGKSEKETEDQKLKREEKELSKIATGIGKVFLHNVREREKLRQWKMSHIDPRNASRTPSAAREPKYHLRYQSPVNASPSRNVDHPRPWEEDELLDRSSSYRSSVGRSVGAIPSYNVVSALRHVPKPGYGLAPRSHTFSSTGGSVSGIAGDYSFSGLGEKTHSTEFSCGKSDISVGSISEVDHRALNAELPVSTTYTGGLGALRSASYSPHLRRSLPNMAQSNSSEPPKIYPYHLLVITNYRLPADVDRCNLERHLSDAEFEGLFGCNRVEFYRLPQWKRNELKRRVRLF